MTDWTVQVQTVGGKSHILSLDKKKKSASERQNSRDQTGLELLKTKYAKGFCFPFGIDFFF